ncbi:uncharacterized protein [Dermacentor albipictus]|uniref:uncharacterized protein n=1 Tax=Dermacentor albipictus TaxID=60249 RepID=UPI0038FC6BB9
MRGFVPSLKKNISGSITIIIIKDWNSEMALYSEIYQASLRPHDPNKPLPDETGFLDGPASPRTWLVYYYYPPYHPDYHQPPPPPPTPPAGVSFVPFHRLASEAGRSDNKEAPRSRRPGALLSSAVIWGPTLVMLGLFVTLAALIVWTAAGSAAVRGQETTEVEPQLVIPANLSVQALELFPSHQQESLPMAALSFDRRRGTPRGPPPPRSRAPARIRVSEAVLGGFEATRTSNTRRNMEKRRYD